MPSTYYVFDLTNTKELDTVFKSIAAQYEGTGAAFLPVFDSDKTRVLIQVKEQFHFPRELMRLAVMSGDVAWASNLNSNPKWNQELTPELNDKTIDYLRGRLTIDAFVQDVKTASVAPEDTIKSKL